MSLNKKEAGLTCLRLRFEGRGKTTCGHRNENYWLDRGEGVCGWVVALFWRLWWLSGFSYGVDEGRGYEVYASYGSVISMVMVGWYGIAC